MSLLALLKSQLTATKIHKLYFIGSYASHFYTFGEFLLMNGFLLKQAGSTCEKLAQSSVTKWDDF